jgi:A/G-specific adenine glycosylase
MSDRSSLLVAEPAPARADAAQCQIEQAARMLLAWYDRNARRLPWRSPPGEAAADPYHVWLSEVMLQQTTVAAVTPYFHAFIARWPSVQALAAADEAEVMRAWAGLGYYARARNLLACARAVTRDHGGRFPADESALRRLPGIGRYTAAAIAAIAFARPAVVVDGNVERVTARLFGVTDPLPAASKRLHALAAALTPNERTGDHAQAMMDLGATVCTPRRPTCECCPLASFCVARRLEMQESLPAKAPRVPRPVRTGIAWWLEAAGHVLLVRRPASGLLGGMLGLPTSAWLEQEAASGGHAAGPADVAWTVQPESIRHIFTHFELRLTLLTARLPHRPELDDRWAPVSWVPVSGIEDAGLPTLFRRAARIALAAAR